MFLNVVPIAIIDSFRRQGLTPIATPMQPAAFDQSAGGNLPESYSLLPIISSVAGIFNLIVPPRDHKAVSNPISFRANSAIATASAAVGASATT